MDGNKVITRLPGGDRRAYNQFTKPFLETLSQYRLHRLLETFFSGSLDEEQKRKVIESEYGIEYSAEMEGSVREMCNVSQGLLEKGEARGRIEGRIEGEKRSRIAAYLDIGKDEEYISKKLGITVEEVQQIAQTLELAES